MKGPHVQLLTITMLLFNQTIFFFQSASRICALIHLIHIFLELRSLIFNISGDGLRYFLDLCMQKFDSAVVADLHVFFCLYESLESSMIVLKESSATLSRCYFYTLRY